MIFSSNYKDFREHCEGCMCKSEDGCGMTEELYLELSSNETLGNMPCKGNGVELHIQDAIYKNTVSEADKNKNIVSFPENTEVLAFAGYQEFEAAADRTAVKIKEGYMEMGYILKMARDTDILRDSEYSGYEEFAEKRYGLDKGTVSRYIRIVERFSEGGNSHVLKDNYKNMGFAKLSIMLHMPDAIAEELMDSLSKTEVQAIREELEEEEKVSDIELAIEGAEAVQPALQESMLTRAVWQLGREQHEIYRKIWKAFEEEARDRIKDIIAPQGDAVYMVRIPGTGRLMISISGEAVSVTEVRSQAKERYTMQDLIDAAERICPVMAETVEESFREVYDEELETVKEPEKKVEVAPVQPKKEKRKESKVTKARTEKPKPAAAVEPEEEEQLTGQMSVEDYEGVVPEAQYEEVTEDAGTDINTLAGMPEGSGAAGDALESGTDAGASGETEDTDTICQYDESTGAAESGGRETDPCAVEDIWMEIYKNNAELTKYLTVWESQHDLMESEMLRKLYDMTVSMAAGFERLLNSRGPENE